MLLGVRLGETSRDYDAEMLGRRPPPQPDVGLKVQVCMHKSPYTLRSCLLCHVETQDKAIARDSALLWPWLIIRRLDCLERCEFL